MLNAIDLASNERTCEIAFLEFIRIYDKEALLKTNSNNHHFIAFDKLDEY